MLIQSLYELASRTRLQHGATILESPEYEERSVAWLIDLSSNGLLQGFIPLWESEDGGTSFAKLPRTLEPKDSGEVSEFLVEDPCVIFGLGESPTKPPQRAALKKHRNFWDRIEAAQRDLDHPLLGILVKWKQTYIDIGHPAALSWGLYATSKGKAKEQWVVEDSNRTKYPLYFRQNTSIDATFRVGGTMLVEDERILGWWKTWFAEWLGQREAACRAARGGGRVCCVTGVRDAPISNSHLPKIKGKRIPNAMGVGASLVSAEAESFHSYGLSIQQAAIIGSKAAPDASYSNVSVRAAIAYCDSLNYLLSDQDHHFRVNPIVFCSWCRESLDAHQIVNLILSKAYPEQVGDMLKSPLAGKEAQGPVNADRLYTIALAGNAGRVVIRQWLDQTLAEAWENLRRWWEDLQIVPVYSAGLSEGRLKRESPISPYSLRNLSDATVRRSRQRKNDDPVGDQLLDLYLSALRGTAPPVMLLKPVLDEFHSALVKDRDEKRTYPFNQSRFALVKLILIRSRKEGGFMPTRELAETTDHSYNCGRLLAVIEALQRRSRLVGTEGEDRRKIKRIGAGIVERYYGTASTAPCLVFPILLKLSRHHLTRLAKGNDKDQAAAQAIERLMADLMARFQAEAGSSQPPEFPKLLSLQDQGKFALGFYQQKAHDWGRYRTYRETLGKEGSDVAELDDDDSTE